MVNLEASCKPTGTPDLEILLSTITDCDSYAHDGNTDDEGGDGSADSKNTNNLELAALVTLDGHGHLFEIL